ncbi:MAG TPA: GspH/FimT family protein [Fimbriimonas sp.]|nr:GspH/FimT family protein [Fimbriimonas sp.]
MILLLLAALVIPNIIGESKDRKVRLFKLDMKTLVEQARGESIRTGHTFGLTFDKAKSALSVVDEAPDDAQQPKIELPPLAVPTEVEAKKFNADQDESPSDGWRIPFFPDGTTAGGGIEFAYAGQPFSLTVSRGDVNVQVVDGPMPDLSLEKWKAGSFTPRG